MAGSAVLRTVTSGQRTVIVAVELLLARLSCGSFVAAAEAVLVTVPQSVGSVAPLTGTVRLAPVPRSPKAQLRVPATTVQAALSSVQVTPAGSASVRVTLRATPGPRLVTVIEKLAVSP